MTLRYMLDTNHVGELVKDADGSTALRLLRVGADRVCTSIVVAAELRFGAAKRQSARLTADLNALLRTLRVQPFETPADVVYGELRADLERRGQPIGGNDMLIAAHAIALDCILVTGNVREFRHVRGLQTESWLR